MEIFDETMLREKIGNLEKKLNAGAIDYQREHELRMEKERDLKAVIHDRELQEKQIKELQEENSELQKRVAALVHECIRLTARVEAAKAMTAVWEKAAEDMINGLMEEEEDDDDD